MLTPMRHLLAILITLSLGCSITAQLPTDDFRPMIRPDDLGQILEALTLSEDEETILRAFFHDFQTEFTRAADRTNDRIWAINQRRQEHRQAHPNETVPDLGLVAAEDEWLQTRRDLEARFIEDVIAILPTDQCEPWEAITRQIRRKRGFAHAKAVRRIRHTADLIAVLDDLDVQCTAALQGVAAQYAADLDRAIREFELNHHVTLRRYSDLRHRPEGESEHRQKDIWQAFEAWSRYPDTINTLNDTYAMRLAEVIEPEEKAAAFRTEVMRREYAAVFVSSPAERSLKSLLALDDLTTGEREALEKIGESYHGAQAARREIVVNALRQWEAPAEVARRSRQYEEIRETGGDPFDVERAHPALPLWEADNRAVHQTCRAIRAVFTDARFRELPIYVQVLLGS